MADHLVGGLHCAEVTEHAAGFVLGALEPAEAAAVRLHLAGCPEPHPEFGELGTVVPALFEVVDIVEPPPALRDRILAAAAADTEGASDTQRATDTQRADDTQVRGSTLATGRPRRLDSRPSEGSLALFRRPVWTAIALAAALAVVALGAWNLQLRNEIADLSAYRNGVVEVLDRAAQPGAQLAVLATPGGAGGPSGLAAVAADGSVAMVMSDLKPTVGSQVYETWLIGADGQPVAVGGFQVGGSGTASLVTAQATAEPGVTVALTLEPGPGATTPTQPIIAVGKASTQSS